MFSLKKFFSNGRKIPSANLRDRAEKAAAYNRLHKSLSKEKISRSGRINVHLLSPAELNAYHKTL